MFIKIIGGLLVIIASSLLGLLFSNRLSLRYKELKGFRRIMQMLETEVIYGATPLPAALRNISGKRIDSSVAFFGYISDILEDRSFYTVKEAWEYAAESVLTKSAFKGEDIELVKSFGNILGSSDREDQRKHFELFYLQLKFQEDAALEEIKRSSKMYRSLGFLLGIAVFVVLA